ncbi:MAG TPA: hypothetical protein VMW24_18720 [Sedimentisphaerales bacterium]|nr:hypothetical protein [Sedimentisphaerales bacterium]
MYRSQAKAYLYSQAPTRFYADRTAGRYRDHRFADGHRRGLGHGSITLIPYYKDVDIRVCPKAPRTIEQGGIMPWVATNRHTGEVNILFMDWSIRPVRLKEFWRLKWHRAFVPTEPQWPQWIEKR